MKTPRADWQAVAAAQRRGFSLFELAVVLVVIAILGTVFLQRVLFYQEEAERVAVAQVLSHTRTSLEARVRSLHLRGKAAEVLALAQENPISWLGRAPPNYLGEVFAPDLRNLEGGNWYFDGSTKILVYLPRQHGWLGDEAARPLLFKVVLRHASQGRQEDQVGVSLVQVDG